MVLAVLAPLLAGRLAAQTFATLHHFNPNSDGAGPMGGLVLSGEILYGATSGTLPGSSGILFSLKTDGTGFRILHNFSPTALGTNNDGTGPSSALILSGNTLYGAGGGGSSGSGTIFALSTNGTAFKVLYNFSARDPNTYTNGDGVAPCGLMLSGTILYGVAASGGNSNRGTVFKINTDGTGFATLHSFTGNIDGATPYARLIMLSNTLYGTASAAGSGGEGTVFKLNTDGTGFKVLHSFSAASGAPPTNSDGTGPFAGLVLSDGVFYGTATGGGTNGEGTAYKLNTDGTGFTTLYHFSAIPLPPFPMPWQYTNSDGAAPYARLTLSGNSLYSTAVAGGPGQDGTAFKLNTDGTGFSLLYAFTPCVASTPVLPSTCFTNSDGAAPYGDLILSGNRLFGTTDTDGAYGGGTVFSISLPPQLTITRLGQNVILTWPTNSTGHILQSATNLVSPVWNTNSVGIVVIDGQSTLTNPVSGQQRFFRLR